MRVSANGNHGVLPGIPNPDDRAEDAAERSHAVAGSSRHLPKRLQDRNRRQTAAAGATGTAHGRSAGQNVAGNDTTVDHAGTQSTSHPGALHGHWLGVGAASLPGQLQWAVQDPNPVNVLGAATGAVMTGAEYLAWLNKGGAKVLNRVYGGAMMGGLLVNTALELYGLGTNAQQLVNHPDSEEAKWNLANSAVHFFSNGVAMALMPIAPEIGFAPLFLPDFTEIHRAMELDKLRTGQELQGRQTEASATGQAHTLASLNATPIINWFAPFYQNALTPGVEAFEHAHGNVDDGKPAPVELPPGTGNNPAVTDYYGSAMNERAGRVAENMTPFLRDAAQKNGKDYVTLISHWPQTFCWPSSGNPMRAFDRTIALTYSRKTDTVVPTFFGRDLDGTFRAPPYNHDIALQQGKQHLFFFSRMLDPGKDEEVLKLHE